MAKEILLYGSIDSYSASDFVKKLEESKNDDIVVRVNSSGGGPEDMYCMVAKFSEHKKEKKIKVDGKAYSCGMFTTLFSDDVECLDVSQFNLHRAAYPSWFEKDSSLMTAAMWENLNKINAKLRAAFEAKIDLELYAKLGKPTIDEVFSNDSRIDVMLDAKEALKIGLVNRIISITPKKRAEINSMVSKISAQYISPEGQFPVVLESKKVEKLIKKYMTIAELKAENPALYAQVFTEGLTAGIAQEADRVNACMAFVEVDPAGVKAAIVSGKNLTQTQMAEFAMKQISAAILVKTEAQSAPVVKTAEVVVEKEKTEQEKLIATAESLLDQKLGFTK
jgi:ATP-dependent protease ClpP protease subunit